MLLFDFSTQLQLESGMNMIASRPKDMMHTHRSIKVF